MVDATDLAYLAGAPFTDDEVDAAIATVRSAAGWHIAPVVEETEVLFDIDRYQQALRLPTRKLISVEEIRDADTQTVVPSTSYRISHTRNQVLLYSSYWSYGFERVEVDFTHGYAVWPQELWPLIAEAASMSRRDPSVNRQTAGVFTVGYGSGGAASSLNPLSTGSALDRYSLCELGIA